MSSGRAVCRGDRSVRTGDGQRGVERHLPLEQREGQRPVLVVPDRGAAATDHPAVQEHVCADDGQLGVRPVELQQGQRAGRSAEVGDPGDGLLPAVAALRQVHGGGEPRGLVGDRAVVGVQAEARAAGGDA